MELWDRVTGAEAADAVEETAPETVIWVEVVEKMVEVDFSWQSERAPPPVLE